MDTEKIKKELENKSTAECCLYLYKVILAETCPKNEEALTFKKAGLSLVAVKRDNRLAKDCMYLYNKLKQNTDEISAEKAKILYRAAQLLKT